MRNLAVLLGKTEDELATVIGKLEELCGFPSEDVRLLAQNKAQLDAKLAQLGLDPHDTTGPELYHSLLAKYDQDAAAIDRALGLNPQSTADQKLAKATEMLGHTLRLRETWALKNSVVKELLRINPPKKLMKKLNYRSLESLLKREDVAGIIVAAQVVESTTWQKNLDAKVAKLSSTNFELHLPKIIHLSPKLADCPSERPVVASELAGAVALWPSDGSIPTLSIALLLMDGLEQLGEQQEPQNLHSAHATLRWWADAEHLLFEHNGQPVSLNFKDVALNHMQAKTYDDQASQNAHQKKWGELMARYKSYVDELPAEVASVGQKARSLRPELALEPVEIYE